MLIANAAFDRVQGAQFRSLINGIADRIWRSEGGRNNPHNTSAAQRRLDALAIAVGLQPPPPATTAATAARTEHGPRNQPANPAPRNPERGLRNQPEPPTPNAAALAGPTEPRSGTQPGHGRGEPAARAPRHPQTDRTATDDNATSAAGDNPDKGPAASGTRNTRHRRTAPSPRPPTRDQQPEPSPSDRQPVSPQPEPLPPDGQPSVSPRLERAAGRGQFESPRLEPAAELGAPPAAPKGQFESPRYQVVIVASADVVSGRDPHGRCEIPGVGPIPQSELERLACDAELFGLLFSGKGEPLWHGRAKRSVTDAQRRALIARDGGCVLCAEEPARCEAHHITPWAKPGNGPTDIDNLALLCGACHRRLHNHKRVLTRNPDGTWATTPDPRHHHTGRAPPPAMHASP